MLEILVKTNSTCENADPIRYPVKPGDVGFDLMAHLKVSNVIKSGKMDNIKTGVSIKLPDGYWAEVKPRSSTFAKRGLIVMGGIIDSAYTGELSIFIYNPTNEDHQINNGDRLAQLIVYKRIVPNLRYVDELPITERADSGFGSTDTI